MNIVKSFGIYMESKSLGFVSDDRANDETQTPIFLDPVPLDAPDKCWWIVTNGGGVITKNTTGEKMKTYVLGIYFRSRDSEEVKETMQAFEEMINDANCDQLEGYDTVELECTSFYTDPDIDEVERTEGVVQVTITTHR